MKTFHFYSLTGSKEVGFGQTEKDAYTSLGYGAGAISALDFVSEHENWEWCNEDNKWKEKDKIKRKNIYYYSVKENGTLIRCSKDFSLIREDLAKNKNSKLRIEIIPNLNSLE